MKTKLLIICILLVTSLRAQDKIKNLILLIPDGTSVDALSLARWYQGNQPLYIDEIICGLVKTNSVDNKITDSAPAGTAYATGSKSKSGYIGVDSAKKALWSVLELAKLQSKSTGIVVTCQFPHATPADFVCHYPDRDAFDTLSRQFVNASPDVVFAGGYKYILENGLSARFTDTSKFQLIRDYQHFRTLSPSAQNKATWALFDNFQHYSRSMSFDCDRNQEEEPSLAEMTKKAIELLSKNSKGFFLMVEGSQIDWAAHSNDPKAYVSDVLAFDQAVGAALTFAKSNKNTMVIVCPDHGNGGVSIGNTLSNGFYDELVIPEKVIKPLKKAQYSAVRTVDELYKTFKNYQKMDHPEQILQSKVAEYYGVNLMENEAIQWSKTMIFAVDHPLKKDSCLSPIKNTLTQKLSDSSYIGWTTHGHTGEDVFLGVYSPYQDKLSGVVDNTEIAKYIAQMLGLGTLPRRKE